MCRPTRPPAEPTRRSTRPQAYPPIDRPVHLPARRSIHPLACLFTSISTHLSACSSILKRRSIRSWCILTEIIGEFWPEGYPGILSRGLVRRFCLSTFACSPTHPSTHSPNRPPMQFTCPPSSSSVHSNARRPNHTLVRKLVRPSILPPIRLPVP